MNGDSAYITFKSVHDAMKAETRLKQAGFVVDAVPIPRKIRPDCGIALMFLVDQKQNIKEYMDEAQITYSEIVFLS